MNALFVLGVLQLLVTLARCESSNNSIQMPTTTLKSGYEMPNIGLGTLSLGQSTYNVTRKALDIGYRLFDTIVLSEKDSKKILEKIVATAINDSQVPRSEIFIVSKITPREFPREALRKSVEVSLKNYGTDYLDLLMMQNMDCVEIEGCVQTGTFLEGWRNMEELVDEGIVRSIGLCHATVHHAEKIWLEGSKPISVIQNPFDPYYQGNMLKDLAVTRGIAYQGYGLFGGLWMVGGAGVNPTTEDKLITRIASKYKVSNGEVVLSWALHRHVSVLPGTTNFTRLQSNFDSFKLKMDESDLKKLDSLDGTIPPGIGRRSGGLALIEGLTSLISKAFSYGKALLKSEL